MINVKAVMHVNGETNERMGRGFLLKKGKRTQYSQKVSCRERGEIFPVLSPEPFYSKFFSQVDLLTSRKIKQ